MRFNMGCGRRKIAGYANVDAAPEAEPDQVWDLEDTPWPWTDNCAEEVLFNHSLEHMGADPKVFLGIMQELYRIGAPGAKVLINVPHPRHDNFISDPTHVRPIMPDTLRLFDRKVNDRIVGMNGANTPLAHYTGVDFRFVRYETVLDDAYWSQLQKGEISQAEINHLINTAYNVVRELRFELEVRKSL
jgi:hypothetical protein